MDLKSRSTALTYKILAHVGVKNYTEHFSDIQTDILTALSLIYVKAHSDEKNGIEYILNCDGIVYPEIEKP